MLIKCHAPVRIDFAGAWTDVSYFANAFGGATLNAAITIHVNGSLSAQEDDEVQFPILSRLAADSGVAPVAGRPALSVSYESSIPAGSGLGTSATLNVVWLALARREAIRSDEDRMNIAAYAYDIEKTLGIVGGKQDQYASAVGGINLFEFTSEGVTRQQVHLRPEQVDELASLLVLCYTGKARLSSNIHRSVWSNFRAGKPETIQALFDLRTSAYQAKAALEQWDLETFGHLITNQRHCMKHLDASTSNDQIEGMFAAVEDDIIGGKPCGAGGGGCVFFIAKDAQARGRIQDKLAALHLEAIDVAFDFDGLVLTAGA